METLKLRRQAEGLSAGLMLQFVLGIAANLFVTIPANHPGSQGSSYATRSVDSLNWILSGKSGWQLTFHVYLGLLLIVGTGILLVQSIQLHNIYWLKISSISLLGSIGAFFNGLGFVDFNKNISSFLMALCWVIALGSLVFGLSRSTTKSELKSSIKRSLR